VVETLFAIPGDLSAPTGGYAYDRRVLALLAEYGVDARHLQLPGSYPAPSAADLAATADLLAGGPPGAVLLIDGLAYGAMPRSLIERLARPIVALVHHPLCLETGLDKDRQEELRRLETEALALARHVVVTSPATRRTLAESFGVTQSRVTVAEPGTDPAPRAKGTGRPVQMLAVGSVVPRKGYEILIDALKPLVHLDWRLDIAGTLDRSTETARRVLAAIETGGLANRVTLHGALSEAQLSDLYDRTDLFVMPSLYEGYGMALAEALARGLAIVCTTGGAAGDTVPDAAALKVSPGDARALMWVLGRALEDSKLRQGMSDAAWTAAARLPRWGDTTRRIAEVLKKVAT
jgi:glycosyltransferase involved in cell wall biosynthesis